jgi:hypothetical protein
LSAAKTCDGNIVKTNAPAMKAFDSHSALDSRRGEGFTD